MSINYYFVSNNNSKCFPTRKGCGWVHLLWPPTMQCSWPGPDSFSAAFQQTFLDSFFLSFFTLSYWFLLCCRLSWQAAGIYPWSFKCHVEIHALNCAGQIRVCCSLTCPSPPDRSDASMCEQRYNYLGMKCTSRGLLSTSLASYDCIKGFIGGPPIFNLGTMSFGLCASPGLLTITVDDDITESFFFLLPCEVEKQFLRMSFATLVSLPHLRTGFKSLSFG